MSRLRDLPYIVLLALARRAATPDVRTAHDDIIELGLGAYNEAQQRAAKLRDDYGSDK